MTAWLAYLVHLLATAAAVAGVARRRGAAGRPVGAGSGGEADRPDWRAARWPRVEIAMGAAVAILLLCLTSGPVLIDFVKAYHHAGVAAVTDPSTLYDCTRAQCFVNVPIVALLFVPFAPLDPYVAGAVFSVLGFAAVAAAMARLGRGDASGAVLWLVLLNGPLYYSVRIGNTTHLLLWLFVAVFGSIERGREWRAGALLAAAAILKPPLVLFLPYLLLRRRYAAAAVMAGCGAAALLLSVSLFGMDLHRFWFRQFVVAHGSEALGAYNVQSAGGFAAHLLTRGHLHDWYPLAMGAAFHRLRTALVLAVVACAAGVCWRSGVPRSRAAWDAELSLVLTVAILAAPIAWTHYYLLLLVPIAALASGRLPVAAGARWPLAAAVWLMSLPVVAFGLQGRIANAVYERLLVSHYFFGGLLLLGVLAAARLLAARQDSRIESLA